MTANLAILASGADAGDLASSAVRVEVCERIGEPTTYRIQFQLVEADGDFPLLADGRLGPGAELTIGTHVGDVDHVLVQGQVHGQRLRFRHGAHDSWVDVSGGDKAFELDREVKAKVWSDVTVSDAITTILSGYGVTADVDAIATSHPETGHTLVQRDTDLRFVRRLARRYGNWFWFTTDATGVTTAHVKRPQLEGAQEATMTINVANPVLAEVELEWDVERPGAAIGKQVGLADLATIDGQVSRSPLRLLGTQALTDVAPARQTAVVAPVDAVGDLQARAEATLIEGGWFIRARGSTSTRALGAVLRTHTLVALDGLGRRHSGGYVVASVRHVIDGDGHVMDFELVRNAWEA
ncbi:MAG: hypothetical protein IPL61_34185 [Myxococcales bacterium]|nr:hypothetical protein [Myxococcales bacterium]